MTARSSPENGPVCARCQQQLAAGTTYCVACGFQNEADGLVGRQMAIESELTKRRNFGSFLRKLFSFIGLGR